MSDLLHLGDPNQRPSLPKADELKLRFSTMRFTSWKGSSRTIPS